MHFVARKYLIEFYRAAAQSSIIVTIEKTLFTLSSIMKSDLAKRLVQSLKDAGINFVTYLPETRLSQIIPLIRDDPDIELIAVSSEQEAVTIAAGATLGGKQAAVYMENTGIYVSSYSLLTVGKQLGVPVLLIVGYLGGIPDQRNSFLYATIGKHTIPVLQGMGIDYMLLEDDVNLEGKIQDAVRGANALRAPYALLFAGEFSV
jgi:sulfopyruvate decarboxylase TPP-binding subunit